jgi:hypothetical protein
VRVCRTRHTALLTLFRQRLPALLQFGLGFRRQISLTTMRCRFLSDVHNVLRCQISPWVVVAAVVVRHLLLLLRQSWLW